MWKFAIFLLKQSFNTLLLEHTALKISSDVEYTQMHVPACIAFHPSEFWEYNKKVGFFYKN